MSSDRAHWSRLQWIASTADAWPEGRRILSYPERGSVSGAAPTAAHDLAGFYEPEVAPAVRGKPLSWGPAILLWIALSLAGWGVLFALGWAALQVS